MALSCRPPLPWQPQAATQLFKVYFPHSQLRVPFLPCNPMQLSSFQSVLPRSLPCFSVLHHTDDVNPLLPCTILKCSRSHFILIKVSQLWQNYVVCCLQYTCTDAFTAYLSPEKMSNFFSLWLEILIKPIFIRIEGIQSLKSIFVS